MIDRHGNQPDIRQLMIMCAPVLLSGKPAQLLSAGEQMVPQVLQAARAAGLSSDRMYEMPGTQKRASRTGLMIFREEALRECLEKRENREYLGRRGYPADQREKLLECKRRLQSYHRHCEEFPHEIGIFLGYPVWDVEEYIRHQGKDYLMNGYWKVYRYPGQAEKIFREYDAAKRRAATGDILRRAQR